MLVSALLHFILRFFSHYSCSFLIIELCSLLHAEYKSYYKCLFQPCLSSASHNQIPLFFKSRVDFT
ncbi:hypothetical protein HCCG_01793 [Helicobacter cinaedi CCUG 18818 = ATCC BAA-847]|uniref:Uncharacterized protein n=1 Tax=Helicobacter cinaedi CCUG 18818 = ATCC BAA-847 TaxID=537971 RepID=A0ABN0BCF5_9HELI|nr:hypothetical protein HCCG_01793 [Helicobacter cinaedi CCUG 18818 = ATCC BAA-847]